MEPAAGRAGMGGVMLVVALIGMFDVSPPAFAGEAASADQTGRASGVAAPGSVPGVGVPYLPSFANSGFMSAVRLRPAGAEFRDGAALVAAGDAKTDLGQPVASRPEPAKPEDAASHQHTVTSQHGQKHAPGAVSNAAHKAPRGDGASRATVRRIVRGGPAAAPSQQDHSAPAPAAGAGAASPDHAISAHVPASAPAAAPGTTEPASATAAHAPAGGEGDASWPRLTGPALARVRAQPQWSPADVALAKARCAHILRSIDAVTVQEAPVREGECGAPAPVRLVSVGKKPQVTLSPAPLLTCDMVQAVHDWMKKDVQPAARKTLHSEVVQIDVMSDYSCRNAYGRARTRLSQHGYANALDIRSFVMAKGEAVTVLDNWGLTGREIAALHARQKQIAAQQRAAPPAVGAAPQQAQSQPVDIASRRPTFTPRPVAEPPASGATAAGTAAVAAANAVGVLTRSTLAEGISAGRVGIGGTAVASPGEALGLGMSRLGGPKPADVRGPNGRAALVPYATLPPDAVPAGGDTRKAHFLRLIHSSACRTFGTVLGPEANNAHRNHLHIDMAARMTGAFCE